MKVPSWIKAKKPHIEKNAFIVKVKVDGYAEFVSQMKEMFKIVNRAEKSQPTA